MITPKLADRKLDATAALQSAFDESAKTGDYVLLEGYFKVTRPLIISGADVRGTFAHAGGGNWSCDVGAAVGPTRIDVNHGGPGFTLATNSATGRSARLCGVAIVSSVLAHDAPSAVCLSIIGHDTVLRDVHLDAPGIGILYSPNTARHVGERLYIRSPRTGGIQFNSNTTIPDCLFRDIYINGRQHPEYAKPSAPTPRAAWALHGLPVSSGFYGRLLLEECDTLLHTGSPINTYIEDLRCEILNVGIEIGRPYTGANYARELHINRLHMQASFSKSCVAWMGGGQGNERTTIHLGSQRYSMAPGGAWAGGTQGYTVRPKGVEWL